MKSALFTMALLSAAPAHAQQSPASLAITNVTVVDVEATDTSKASKAGQTVLVAGERITAVGPTGSMLLPAATTIVDGRGKFLIPGLWDMHVHMFFDGMREQMMALFVPNGVTGVRDMGGEQLNELAAIRRSIANGQVVGPRIVAAGPLVDGPKPIHPFSIKVSNAAEGREAVRTLKRDGADFVKPYSLLPREAYFAIAEESKRQALPFAGHVPHVVTAIEASDAGQKSVEHYFYIDISSAEQELRREFAGSLDKGQRSKILDRAIATVDDAKVSAIGRRFARNGTWFVPTLIASRGAAFTQDPKYLQDQRRRFLPKQIREWWESEEGDVSSAAAAQKQLYYAADLRVTRLMHAAGAGILAGSDMVNPNALPGFGLHDELELLVEAGMPPLQALQAATYNPALYLERSEELGSVKPGKYADLILLEANPLERISNTRRISAVFLNGKYLPGTELVEMLGKAEASASEPEPSD